MSSMQGLLGQMHQVHGAMGEMAQNPGLMGNNDAMKAFHQAGAEIREDGNRTTGDDEETLARQRRACPVTRGRPPQRWRPPSRAQRSC